MDYVPSMAAVAAAAQKTPHADAATLATSKAVSPVERTALDPRSIYTLTPETADAVLSLAGLKAQAVSAADFDTRYLRATHVTETAAVVATAPVVSPEPTKAVSASIRTWNEDVRLDHIPTRKVGTDTVVQYDTPRVIAAWNAAFPDLPKRRYRTLTPANTHIRPETGETLAAASTPLAASNIYLVCNTDNYRAFSETHPHTHIKWIPVDNEETLLFWPSEQARDEEGEPSAHRHDPESGAKV